MPFTAARASRATRSVVDARAAERCREIDGDDIVPIFIFELNEQVVFGDPGVGDENIELLHFLFGSGHQPLHFIFVAEICRKHVHPVFELARQLIKRLASGPRDCNRSALFVHRAGDRAADAASGAGDQSSLAGQIEHVAQPRLDLNAATSPGEPTVFADAFAAMRLINPLSTLPAPTS